MKASAYTYQLSLSDCHKDNQRPDGEGRTAPAIGVVGRSILSSRQPRADH